MIQASDHSQINTVRLSYDLNNTKDAQGNLVRGYQGLAYRIQLAQQAASDATAAYLNSAIKDNVKAKSALSNLKLSKTANDANLAGAGEGAIFSSNGGYGTLPQQVERVGRAVSEIQTLRHSAVSEQLAPSLLAIKSDPQAAAEWGAFTFARHSTDENYVFLDPALAKQYNLPDNTTVLENSIQYKTVNGVKQQVGWDNTYRPPGFVDGGSNVGDKLKTYYSLSDKVADAEKASQSLLNQRNEWRDGWRMAQGLDPQGYNPDVLYAPPINTAKYRYFALVKDRPGLAGGTDDTHYLVGASEDDLRSKVALLPSTKVAYYRSDIAEFKKAEGTYNFNRNFTSLKTKSDLGRAGLLTGQVPEFRADNLVNDLVNFHRNQETQLLRDYVELHNAKFFDQVQAMGQRYVAS